MVAPAVPSVRLAAGDDASGMAVMLGELLTENLADYPGRARAARAVRGRVAMTAADHDRSVTVHFTGRTVVVEEGAAPGVPAVTGAWLDLAQLCSGRLAPVRAVREHRLALSGARRIDLLAAAGYVLSVPASYYGETPRWRRRRFVVPAVALGVGVLVLVAMRTPRR